MLVAENTRRLVGDLFEYRNLGAAAIRGLAEPVLISQVLNESIIENRFEALRSATLSPLVGRDEEVQLLLRRWALVKDGEGQIALLSGEASANRELSRHYRSGWNPSDRFSCAISAHRTVATARSFRLLPGLSARRASIAMMHPRLKSTS